MAVPTVTTPTVVEPAAAGDDPLLHADATDRYELLSYLGHGGMGVVFRARDRLTGELVALKRMTSRASAEVARELMTAPAGIAEATWEAGRTRRLALAREFRMLARLRHPNIISVLDYGFAANAEPFFTMELLAKPRSLLDEARDRPIAERVALLVQVLRALSYLHRRGVIHRDLKPSNVLVDDRVRVLDFGVAVQRGEGANASGTLSHMAPEVMEGGPATEASDLYAVGVMACQVLSGRHPFAGYLGDALREAVRTRAPELDGIEPPLLAVVAQLLAADPSGRLASADAAIDGFIEAAGLAMPRQTKATRESFLEAAQFVARVEEQRLLSRAVAELMTHRTGGVWMIEGQSGIGKSRLLDELRTQALVAGTKVVRGQADGGAAGRFDLWREPLRQLLLGTELDGGEVSPLLALVPDAAALLRREVPPSPADPATARAQMLRTISLVFERQRAPVLVILEDLHLARSGAEVLAELAPRLRSLPVLFVGSYRGEEAPGLAQTIPDAQHMRLGPLERDHIAALAGSMLGHAQPSVVDFLDRHSEGNVFFIVETVRALAEGTGSLEDIGMQPLPEKLVTSGIEAVVARRLAKLPDAARDVLRFAAVVGRALDAEVLANQFGTGSTGDAIALANEMMLLEANENRFRFSHDKIREYLRDSLDAEQRRELHRRAAAAIERVHGAGKAWAATLAYHHREADQPDREAPLSALAGQAALEQGAYDDATRLLERALALHAVQPPADRTAELDILLTYGAVILATRSWSNPDVKRVYDRVTELAGEIGAQERMIAALHGQAMVSQFRGDLRTARELATRYNALAEASGDVVGQIQATLILANVATWLGHHAEAEPLHQRVIELYDPAQLPIHMSRYAWNPRIVVRVTHAMSACIRGEADLGVEMYREAIEMAEAMNHPFMIAIAYQIAAWVHHLRGEVAETLRYADLLVKVSGEQFPAFAVLGDTLGGWAMVHGGTVEPGLGRIRGALVRWRRMGAKMIVTFYATHLADACLAAGELDEARRVLGEALARDAATQERCYHAELYRLLAEVHRRSGDPEQATAALATAVALAREQGAVLFERRALKQRG